MNVLLTGATGFIGKQLVKRFDTVTCVIRKGRHHSFSKAHEVTNIDGSTDWSNALKDIDVVIHLAGVAHNKVTHETQHKIVNTEGTLQLANQAAKAGVKRFVYLSSIVVNGTSTTNTPFTVDSVPSPQSEHAKSKYDAEIGLKDIAGKTGLEVVVVRATLVYGPNPPGNFGLLIKLVDKFPMLPFGCVRNRRNFIAVQNLVDLLVTCSRHPKAAGHIFLASDGEAISTRELTNAIANALGKKILQIPIPVSIMRLAGKVTGKTAVIEQLLGNLEVDSSNAQKVLGWTPPFTMEQAMTSLGNTDN